MVILKFKVKKSQEYIHFSLCFRYVSNWLRDRIESSPTLKWLKFWLLNGFDIFMLQLIRFISFWKEAHQLSFELIVNFANEQEIKSNGSPKCVTTFPTWESLSALPQKRTEEIAYCWKSKQSMTSDVMYCMMAFDIVHFSIQKTKV